MSAYDPKRTSAVHDFCSANGSFDPIPLVANPCCNLSSKIGVVLPWDGRCDGAPEEAAKWLQREAAKDTTKKYRFNSRCQAFLARAKYVVAAGSSSG